MMTVCTVYDTIYVQLLTGERQEFKYFRADGAENVQSCTRGRTTRQDRNPSSQRILNLVYVRTYDTSYVFFSEQ